MDNRNYTLEDWNKRDQLVQSMLSVLRPIHVMCSQTNYVIHVADWLYQSKDYRRENILAMLVRCFAQEYAGYGWTISTETFEAMVTAVYGAINEQK